MRTLSFMTRFLSAISLLLTLATSGCATSGKSNVETIDVHTVDVSAFRTIDFNVHSTAPDSAEAVSLVRSAISPNGVPIGNSKGTLGRLVVDVDLVSIDCSSTFTRFMIGLFAGPDRIVAKVTLIDEHEKTVGRFRIEAEQNGGVASSTLRGASERLVESLFKSLRT